MGIAEEIERKRGESTEITEKIEREIEMKKKREFREETELRGGRS